MIKKMKITTKFKIGDEPFILYNDRVHKVLVTAINVFTEDGSNIAVDYRIRFAAGGEHRCSESRLFETKLSLLNSL